ncbi:TonB-dependent receptor [Burkholderia sp. WAC0059]|uniref:TonB-dependent receptor n=1 Tax=Burkholderia sp. WAC0059 TaxID=2066022 RepID=UPI000C7F37AC|nr:TonB-dependent receptor [Burkholderia sp. WAC0059]PLZ00889.1 TonB-dependent receptor [Burkholderia sp. WAC0059]
MKQKALTLAIRHIMWAGFGLSAAMAAPAFAQSLPATTATPAAPGAAVPAAAASGATAAAAAPASGAAATQSSSTGKSQKLKTFEVTGSLIRQTDKTGYNSVQVISQKDIQQSGSTTVANYLQQLTANSASSWNENDAENFAPGAAGIALRGLSEKYTLVLVDGQRVAPYGFASNGTDTFFDLDTIPVNMVDRIEVVKSGGVSQYGSDAIAGVVNIITKHDFQGLQLDGNLGGAAQGGQGTVSFSALGGFGNLVSDGYNITAAASYYRSSGITWNDRSTTENMDYTGYAGGFNTQPVSFFQNPTTGVLSPTKGCFGSVVPVNGSKNLLVSQLSEAGVATGGSVCQANESSAEYVTPEVQRTNIKIHGDFKINDNVQAWADAWESYDTTMISNGYAHVGGNSTPFTYTPAGGIQAFNNATTDGELLNYLFPEQQSQTTVSNFYRLSTGLKGELDTSKFGTWNWAASYGHSQSSVSNSMGGQVNANVLSNYLSTTSSADFDGNTLNNLPGILQSNQYQAISKLDTVDATISTPDLFHLPTGDVGVGFGAQFQHQSEYIGPGSYAILDPIVQSVDGQRNVGAVYYQFDIPILRNLTFSQSGRYDHYSDVGGAFSPRFALRYQPVQAFTAYASYDRGFRAPTLVEEAQKNNIAYQSVNSIDGPITVTELLQGNPNLQPERTKNYNVGFELSPARNTDIGLDWYKINITNVIGSGDPTTAVNNYIAANGTTPTYINEEFANLAFMTTDGFEGTFRQGLPTKLGTFTFSADWAWVWHFKMPAGVDLPVEDIAGNNLGLLSPFGAAFPRWKGNTSLSWASPNRHWTTTLTWQYTGPYTQDEFDAPDVASYSQFNLYAAYTGFKHWTLYAGVDNIFNHKPPFDGAWQEWDGSYYDTSLYTDMGVYGQVGATYRF